MSVFWTVGSCVGIAGYLSIFVLVYLMKRR